MPAFFLFIRYINTELAKRECSEARFTHNGKRYFAIAFPNASGGFEVRNRYFKGCIAPKEISHIRQSGKARNTCYVFEGFMDYLSFLTLRQESCPNYPELDGQDYIVLNSVSNVNKALYPLGSYERIHCFLITTMQAWKPSNKSARNTAETDTSVTLHKLTADVRT